MFELSVGILQIVLTKRVGVDVAASFGLPVWCVPVVFSSVRWFQLVQQFEVIIPSVAMFDVEKFADHKHI